MHEPTFKAVSVILPVMDETVSLEKTVKTIISDCGDDILEFIIVVSKKTTSESLAVCDQLRNKYGDRIKIFQPSRSWAGPCAIHSNARWGAMS
jgi:glycosyltransferase involved in cell wall biosynthesis